MSKAKINYILFPFFAKALIGARTTLIIFFNITGFRHNVLLCADNPLCGQYYVIIKLRSWLFTESSTVFSLCWPVFIFELNLPFWADDVKVLKALS